MTRIGVVLLTGLSVCIEDVGSLWFGREELVVYLPLTSLTNLQSKLVDPWCS